MMQIFINFYQEVKKPNELAISLGELALCLLVIMENEVAAR